MSLKRDHSRRKNVTKNSNTLENRTQEQHSQMVDHVAMNKTVDVQGHDRGVETNEEAERLETKMEEMGSRRGHSKNINLISPLQIIR